MSLSASRAKLLRSLKDLNHRMDRVNQDWNDRVQRQLQTEAIDPLDAATRSTITAIEHLEQVLARARGDCE
ncbi:MAG: hypothetical protein AB8G96_10750 [Phycisphaerales bacterium]